MSAAIAAAGAVQAKREQLAYTASLVILFALPSIFVLPALATGFGLEPAVAGAWIGGNIDTTAAVTAVIATIYLNNVGADAGKPVIDVVNDLREWFLILAFVSIGLEFSVTSLKEAGWRPIGVFAAATGVNLILALGTASILFAGVEV